MTQRQILSPEPIAMGRRSFLAGLGATALVSSSIGSIVTTAQAANPRVGVTLAIVQDTSGSIDNGEYALQRDGTARAFAHKDVHDVIMRCNGIGVCYLEFDISARLRLGWRMVDSPDSALAFSAQIAGLERTGSGGTNVDSGADMALDMILASPFRAERMVIDISGDEYSETSYGRMPAARDRAHYNGVVINALALPSEKAGVNLVEKFSENVRTPTGFVLPVESFAAYESAMIRKLVMEIAGITPPNRYGALPSRRPSFG